MKTAKHHLSTLAIIALSLICGATFASAQVPRGTLTSKATTVVLDVSPSTYDACIEAAKTAGITALEGKPMMIPVEICKGIVSNECSDLIRKWIACRQICQLFQRCMMGQMDQDYLTLEIVLAKPGERPGPTAPRLVVKMFAKREGAQPNGQPKGYIAPVDGQGNPIMRKDVFGDGSLILQRISCPCE